MDTYTYDLGRAVYVNLTNQCTNDCSFCVRQKGTGVGPYELWLEREPEASEIISELEQTQPASVVFCGFGEPTMRLGTMLEVARYVKGYGGRTRLDTNGHGSLYNGRDIVPELAGLIDEVSISLNEASARAYQDLCASRYGERSWEALQDFARKARDAGIGVTLSVVDLIGEQKVEQCRKIAEDMGVRFRARCYVP
ncbi:MAG: radical SAM protein [Clostridia bacterium]|nr:radical SAM protein [Clostridia bacterium]